MPLTERQQLAYLLSMTAKENKANEDSSEDVAESRKVKKAKLSPVSSINRPRNKNGETQLHICTMKGELEVIKSMVKQGADVNCRDNANWTPLHEACNHGHYKIAKLLLKSGANVNAAGLEGDTPLHDASSNGHLKIVLLLLRHGADPHHKNDHGDSPIDVAEGEEVVEALQNFTKEMLKDLKPKKDFTPEKYRYKEDVESNKKLSHKSSKSHKKTISNIDDFLGTSSPIHPSKDSNRDDKRTYEKTPSSEKGSLKSKKDSDRSYMDSDSSSMDSTTRYSDGGKKQKSSSSKSSKHKESFSTDYKSEKISVKKSSESDSKYDERKRHHSESSVSSHSGKKLKDSSSKSENKFDKHLDKRIDDSDDDVALAAFVAKDSRTDGHHYSTPKKVRKHSLSLDSEVKEKYYVKDEREHDRKTSEFSKGKDPQLHKKSDHKPKDEMSPEKSIDHKMQSKLSSSMPSSSFNKAMKESFSSAEKRPEKSLSKKLLDPRMKTQPDSYRNTYSNEETVRKKLSHSFSGSEYKAEKSLSKSDHIDKQSLHRERKHSGGSNIDDQKEIKKAYPMKKVKGGVINEFKPVTSNAELSVKYDVDQVGKERREKSPFGKSFSCEGKLSSYGGEKDSHMDSKESCHSHVKRMESKISLVEEKSEPIDKSISKKQDFLQKAKKTSEMLNKTYLGDTSRSKSSSYEHEEKSSPEFHDTNSIKKTYLKLEKSVNREHEKKSNVASHDLSKPIIRDHDKKVITGSQDFSKHKHKNKHKMAMKNFLLKEDGQVENKSQTHISGGNDFEDVSLKVYKESAKLKKEKTMNKEKNKKESLECNESKNDTPKSKSNLSKYKNFLDDSDDESEKQYGYHDSDKNKHHNMQKSEMPSSSGTLERKDNRTVHEMSKDKEKVGKKEVTDIYHQKSINMSGESLSRKEFSEKVKSATNQQHSIKMESDTYDGSNMKKKSTSKEKINRLHFTEYENLHSSDDSFSLKKEDQLVPTEAHGDPALSSLKSNFSTGKELTDKKISGSTEKTEVSRTGQKVSSHTFPVKGMEKTSMEHICSVEGTEKVDSVNKHNTVGKSKSLDLMLIDNRAVLEKEKRRKEKMKQKLKKSASLHETSESLQKHGDSSKEREKIEKGHKLSANIMKIDKPMQDVHSINKLKGKDIIQEHKSNLKVKHGKTSQEVDVGDRLCDHMVPPVSVPKIKGKESSHEFKGHLKIKDTVKFEHGLSLVSPSKSKGKEDVDSARSSDSESCQEMKSKAMEIREKHETLRSTSDSKVIETGIIDHKNVGKAKETKGSTVLPSKYKSFDEDSDCTVEYEDTESSEETPEIKEAGDKFLDTPLESVLTTREYMTKDRSEKFSEALSGRKSSHLMADKETHGMGIRDEVISGTDIKYFKEKHEFDEIDCKNGIMEEKPTKSGCLERDLQIGAEDTGLCVKGQFDRSHVGDLESYLETKSASKNQIQKDGNFDMSISEMGVKSDSCLTKNDPDGSSDKTELSYSVVSDKLKRDGEAQEHSLLPDLFENDDKVIEEHILTCGPKLDKSSKHKIHSSKREITDGQSDAFRKKHKRKHSDEISANLHHGCSKTKKSRSLDSDMPEGKASNASAPTKELKLCPVSGEDASPKKRHKQSKSSDGTENRYKGHSADGSTSVESSTAKHPETDHLSPKLLKHGNKDEKSKSLSGTKHTDSMKIIDSSLPSTSPIKTEFKACVRAINAKDSDKAAKLKEVDLNMNLGLNDTALELVKKKKRKRNSDSKDSNSDLRVLKVPTESISVENIPSPEEIKINENSSSKEGKLSHVPSSHSSSNKVEGPPVSSKTTEMPSIVNISPSNKVEGPPMSSKTMEMSSIVNISPSNVEGPPMSSKTMEMSSIVNISPSSKVEGPHVSSKTMEMSSIANISPSNKVEGPPVSSKTMEMSSIANISPSNKVGLPLSSKTVEMSSIVDISPSNKVEGSSISCIATEMSSIVNRSPSIKVEGPPMSSKTTEISSMTIISTEVSGSSNNKNISEPPSSDDIKPLPIPVDEIKPPVISSSEPMLLDISTSEVKISEFSSMDIDTPHIATGEIKSREFHAGETGHPEKVSEIFSENMKSAEVSFSESKLPEVPNLSSAVPKVSSHETKILEKTNQVTQYELSIVKTELPESSCDFRLPEISSSQNKEVDVPMDEVKSISDYNNDTKLSEASTSKAISQKYSLYGDESTEISLPRQEVTEPLSSEKGIPQISLNDLMKPEMSPTEINAAVASLEESNLAKDIEMEAMLSEPTCKMESTLNTNYSSFVNSNEIPRVSTVDEPEIHVITSNEMASTSSVALDSHKTNSFIQEETKQDEFSLSDNLVKYSEDNLSTSIEKHTEAPKTTEETTFSSHLGGMTGLKDTAVTSHQPVESSNFEKSIGYESQNENKGPFITKHHESNVVQPTQKPEVFPPAGITPPEPDQSTFPQDMSRPEVVTIPDVQKVDDTFQPFETRKADGEPDKNKQTISEQQLDDERNEENENAVVNLLNMNREIDAMSVDDNVSNISNSILMLNSSNYIQKGMKDIDNYMDENNDSFQDDSSQGSACSTLMDFDNSNKTEDENLSNIFDQLNNITKSMTQNQFNESVTKNSLPEQVQDTPNEGSLPAIANKINPSIISLGPEMTPISDLISVSNIPSVDSQCCLNTQHVSECSSSHISNSSSENIDTININPVDVISKMPYFETPIGNKGIQENIAYECGPKGNEKEIGEDISLTGNNELALKNDEFSELILPGNLTTAASFGQRHIDLDSIDTSDLLKPEKSDILSTSSDSIILKKDLIDGQLGFSTNLSSDEIISKFADCILELDDTDNTYSLREYIPPPPMDCSGGQQEKQFISTISSVVSSISMEGQCDNMSVNDNMAMNQFYSSTDSMYMPNVPPFNAPTAAVTTTDTSTSLTSISQPLYVNTVNTVTTRLSTTDDKLYSSPKHIFARGKIYSPKTSVTSSSNGQSRRVSIEPCDMLRSIIESDVPVVPEPPPVSTLPTIPEDAQEKEEKSEKAETASASELSVVKSESQETVSQAEKTAVVLPPRLRNWREAIQRRCSKISHAVNARDLDMSLRKVIREPKYEEVLDKANAYNLPEEMVMRHASEKEKLRIHMIQEWCRAEQHVDLLSKEKGPLSGMSILYYQKDHIARKLGTTLDFKAKASIKPDFEKLRHARLTDLEDKLERMQQEIEKRHQMEIEAHQKVEQLETIFDQKNMLRQRYLRLRNKMSV